MGQGEKAEITAAGETRVAALEAAVAERDAKIAEQQAQLVEQKAQIALLAAQVAKLTEQQGRNSKNSHLPPSSDGPGMDESLKRVVKAAKIPPISSQSFRRTWENILREAGVDQLVRRALAGWRSEKAQGIYATVDRSEREAAADAAAKLVNGDGS